jgi:AraC-like DNA-binding protein
MGRLVRECVAATGCEYFGLFAGQQMRLSQLGMPGEMARNSPTLGAALRAFFVHHYLNSQGAVWVLSEHDGLVSASYAVYEESLEGIEQIYDGVVAVAFNVIREICGPRWLPELVLFAHAKPGDLGPYRKFFRAPLRFDSERTALVFRARWLQHPVRGADASLLRILEAEVQATDQPDFSNKLRRSTRELLLSGRVLGHEVAALLSVHKRTLNRRLKTQGTTFQRVLSEVRFEAARQLLGGTQVPMLDIATSLGYTDASSFSRAYRRWSGTTPSRTRRTKPATLASS